MTKDIEREAFKLEMMDDYNMREVDTPFGKDFAMGSTKQAFKVWQAAKAQAIPEGFVLVPMVPSERMIKAVRQCYEGEAYLPYSLYSEFVNQAIIERMEAQEQAND